VENASFKLCPFCKEQIRKEAVKCRFCGEWLEQQTSPLPFQPQEAKATEQLTRPNNENIPVQEPQPEQKQTWLEDVSFGAGVFRDLQESLNLNPSREQWEHEFLARKKPQNPISPDKMDALWKDSSDAGKKSDSVKVASPNIPAWQPSAKMLFRFRLVSALLLAASFSILLFFLIGSHGDPQKISDLIVSFLGKAGIVAFLLWFSFGKKKGVGVLLFAIFCFLFTVYAGWHAVKTKRENASFDKLVSVGVALIEHMTNSDNFTPQTTGNKNMDQVMSLVAKYGAFFKQLSTDMDSKLQDAGEPNIYSEAILNDKEKIRASISIQSKRQKIIETYRAKGHDEIERTALELSEMHFSDSAAKGMVEGFNGNIKKARPLMDEIFTLRSNLEAAKERFLQFMLEKHGSYKLDTTAITFNKNTDSKQYGALTKTVDDDAKALDDLIANMLKSADATKEELKKMAQ